MYFVTAVHIILILNNSRFLATGDPFRTIAFSFQVGVSRVSQIIPQVATAIWDCLVDDFMAVPSTADWQSIAEGFQERWNFPLCWWSSGWEARPDEGTPQLRSMFPQLQGNFFHCSPCGCDARYRFRVLMLGVREDQRRWYSGQLHLGGSSGWTLHLPPDHLYLWRTPWSPAPCLCAHEAFPWTPPPFREEGCLRCPLLTVEVVSAQVCERNCVLHNFLRCVDERGAPAVRGVAPAVVEPLQGLGRIAANNSSREAVLVREKFMAHFSAEGALSWQPNEQPV
uniref:Uncharacterized protein n=1 Tax=Maylandia zebra TaxID=106582 RepID=A0A3P9BAJ4_9CICH